ncbi:NUDIX hydrolase [Sporosarcina cyprini]|uniref:NUDIX hydrolase n=1 Tax=Sporosarcina cyprini TaxID=2910523 RepID=UPI001EE10A7B|nr:NUDIX domain-containing protein [Sporosarcina cyprini]MCG3086979.1 NUDIX domain-containing protein [Sporosarcina cyprini]
MEKLKVYDEQYNYVCEESRDVIHAKGLWHETFHCWLVDGDEILIQKRSAAKKDFPGLFDITAAGHLLSDEKVMDGLREVEEELGVSVDEAKLQWMGVVRDVIELPGFIDREFTNVFLYSSSFTPADFSLQEEEVASIHAITVSDLQALFRRTARTVQVRNIENDLFETIELRDFVPHETSYLEAVAAYFG